MKILINYPQKGHFFLLFVLIFLTVSCVVLTFKVPINPKLDNIPKTKKADATVGIYYSPEFKNYIHLRIYSNDKIQAAIGAKSVEVINKVFSDSFDNVVEVSAIPGGSDKIDYYVEPILMAHDFKAVYNDKKSDRQEIVVNFTFYSNEGMPIKSFKIRGKDPLYKKRRGWKHVSYDMENLALNLAKELAEFSMPDMGQGRVESPIKKDDIKLTANVVQGLEKQVKEFDSDLESYYVIPVEIDLKNISGNPITFRNTDIRLILENKRKIPPAKGPHLLTQFEKISYSSDIAMMLGGPLVAAVVEVSEEGQKRDSRVLREEIFLSKEIKSSTLNKNESAEGFVYFVLFDKDKTLNKEDLRSAKLEMWVLGKNPYDAVKLEVPLEDINWLTEEEAEKRIKKRTAETRKKTRKIKRKGRR